ncbi:hypothetical protein [Paraliobacillus sp. JSM ZJ581]
MTRKDNKTVARAANVTFSQSAADSEDKEALDRMKQANNRVERKLKE